MNEDRIINEYLYEVLKNLERHMQDMHAITASRILKYAARKDLDKSLTKINSLQDSLDTIKQIILTERESS